ncbi:unnamed protein product, partial [Didymodactylos carnosus]
FVHKFRLREKSLVSRTEESSNSTTSTTSKADYECLCIGSQNIGTRKPVIKLKVISLFRRVLVLSDSLIQLLDSDSLQPIPNIKIKNVLIFSVKETSINRTVDPQFIEICVSTKKNKLQIHRLDKTSINLTYELSVQDAITMIGMDDYGIVACTESQYLSYNPNDRRGTLQNIFTLDEYTNPYFTRVNSGEFLLNGPNVGVYTTIDGTSQRAPIMWLSQPYSFLYSHPYIIVIVKDHVHVYSFLDDKLKQEIPLKNCRTVTYLQQQTSPNSIIITTKDVIYLLEPVTLEEQIEQLLTAYRLQEALTLAESSSSPSSDRLIQLTKKRIGLIEFTALNVVRAFQLFIEADVDYHDIVAQIPNCLPLISPWPLSLITGDNHQLKTQYLQWLNTLYDYMTQRKFDFILKPDYHLVLLKAMMIIKLDDIPNFIQEYFTKIPLEFDQTLIEANMYHYSCLLNSYKGNQEQALNQWKRLISNELIDDKFPGVQFVCEHVIERINDRQLAANFTEWLLTYDENLALKIYTEKYDSEELNDPFRSDRIIECLRSNSTILTKYLEYLVFQQSKEVKKDNFQLYYIKYSFLLQRESLHTMLVNVYLDKLLREHQNVTIDQDETNEIRKKLQTLLITSNSYRVQHVLTRLNQSDLFRREVALLYGKMNDYTQAFKIIVNELHDYIYAEKYCVYISYDKTIENRQHLFHTLFKILLASLNSDSEKISNAIKHLLGNSDAEFDFIEILQLLPSSFSLTSLIDILSHVIRLNSHTQRSKKIESSLCRVQNENLKRKLNICQKPCTKLTETRQCAHCFSQFYEPIFVLYNDGTIVHVQCARDFRQID